MPRFTEPTYAQPELPPVDALLAYYEAAAPLMLPHVARRPLNLLRCSGGRCFFQRNRNHPPTGAGFFAPPIREFPIAQKNGRIEPYLYADSVDGLLACVAARAVEFHAWGCRIDEVERPDRVVLDLDPGEGVGFAAVREAALQVRRSLQSVGLESWPLLTGGKGVHVVVPIRPEGGWPEVRAFARTFCAVLAEAAPDRFTIALAKAARAGRIFLDYLRNQRTSTAIMPWSLRARDGAPLALPLSWTALAEAEGAVGLTLADGTKLARQARAARGWGESDQSLPVF